MNNYIYRNYTVEYLFSTTTYFSGYGELSLPPKDFDNIILFYQLGPHKTPEQQLKEIDEIRSKIELLTNQIKDRRIIIITLYQELNHDWELKNRELSTAINYFNYRFLKSLVTENPHIKVIDINQFLQCQLIEKIDWRFFFTSQMIINPKLAKSFKEWFYNQLNFITLKRKKCIVLDCDNTLWGGILGEEGIYGVKLGQDYPGNAYKSFQELLFALSQKGVILAVCSKNNLEDVQDLWKHNPNNLINDAVLSAYRINWENKAENIRAIAEELNIGLDSLVFVDDSPVERGIVRKFLPDVVTPDFPLKPYGLVDFFWNIYNEYFATFELSAEDLKKTEQYKEILLRKESQKKFENLDDYFVSLDMIVDIIPISESNITRIAQMTQKTNQFNLRTQRYTEEDLRKKVLLGSHIFCANVKDKFGDNGITIAAIIDENEHDLFLDSYLLSCRILGRGIEKVTILSIINDLINKTGKNIRAEYIPTKKNKMTQDFLEEIGFILQEEDAEGVKKYIFDQSKEIDIKSYYTIRRR